MPTPNFSNVSGFEWDKGNADKSWRKHKVTNLEAEEVFFNQPLLIFGDRKHSSKEARYLAYGRTNANRKLTLVFVKRSDLLRVISARPQSKKEKKIYENKKDTTI